MLQFIRRILLVLVAKPFAKLVIGLDVHGSSNLPTQGPAIIAANHNSHIDTLILICLFRSSLLSRIRPVAAADHFLGTPVSSWFYRKIVGIIPVNRTGAAKGEDVLAGCKAALAEEMGTFKSGIARLAEAVPDAPVVPVYIQGAGRVLPRGAKIIVPFNCSAIIGEAFQWSGDKSGFMTQLLATVEALRSDAPPLRWL